MPDHHTYYDDLKERFLGANDAKKFVAGVEYLASEQILWRSGDFRAAAYVAHNKFISKFFSLEFIDDINLNNFVNAYILLLNHFSDFDNEDKDAPEFKQVVTALLNSIIDYDKSNQLALTLASKLVDYDLPPEFCLVALTRANIDSQPEAQQQVKDIFDFLYNKPSVWSDASTPNRGALSVTPTTPEAMTAMALSAESAQYSKHVNEANLAFLFYWQSCAYTAKKFDTCKFLDTCLSTAVAALTLDKDKAFQWRLVLDILAKYPKGTMQQRWRSRIVQHIHDQYNKSPAMLESLGVQPRSCWTWLFSACCLDQDTIDEYEPKPVFNGGKFVIT